MAAADWPRIAPPPGEDWAGDMGARWLAHLDRFEGMIAPIGDALLRRANLPTGTVVLDLGCGGGTTTLAAARAVAPGGRAVGLDLSQDLIARARERALEAGADNIAFVCSDAAQVRLEAEAFDQLISRFGSMFFPEPPTAFAHLHGMLRAGGQIDLAVWAAPRENPWMAALVGVVRRYIDLPRPEPRTPGPFAFEDPEYLGDVLTTAGFSAVETEPWSGDLPFGGPGATTEEAVAFALTGMAFQDRIQALDARTIGQLSRELEDLYRARETPDGVMMPAKAWLVRARA